ncbi:hypothetical protein TNCV_3939951 [Trichonephila clavipes]|uniref:Uncharacterized protein n=1 Tax=Trichonephila clavipes TaxID=2585209 RepID=A0A8X7B9T0_TRICX|nr:hypothetical protein TNCV_3939951 [Trichonephila clavipes]
MTQNDVAKSPWVDEQCDVNIHSLMNPNMWPASHEFEVSVIDDPLCRWSRCTLNVSRLNALPLVWPSQMSSSSLERFLK